MMQSNSKDSETCKTEDLQKTSDLEKIKGLEKTVDIFFEERKKSHIYYSLSDQVQTSDLSDLSSVEFIPEALPSFDFQEIQTQRNYFGYQASYPFLISSMTAGHEQGEVLNQRLARAASGHGWLMAVGSQRRELENSAVAKEWVTLRKAYPKLPLIGNIGIAQVITSSVESIERLVNHLEALALFVHLNPLQEVFQREGTPCFKGGYQALEKLCRRLSVPVLIKEVGSGISSVTAQRLESCGVQVIDVAGRGGTHWGLIEGLRAQEGYQRGQQNQDKKSRIQAQGSQTFRSWGLGVVESLLQNRKVLTKTSLWASGGVRSGLDGAKLLALGAQAVGFAQPLLKGAYQGEEALDEVMSQIEYELKVAMFCSGCETLEALNETVLKSQKLPFLLAQTLMPSQSLSQSEVGTVTPEIQPVVSTGILSSIPSIACTTTPVTLITPVTPVTPVNEPARERESKKEKKFSQFSFDERLHAVSGVGGFNDQEQSFLKNYGSLESLNLAENFIENALGYMALPLGVVPDLIINGRSYWVPMAVEETSIIAALSKTAKWIRQSGDLVTEVIGTDIIGQIQIGRVQNKEQLERVFSIERDFWMDLANRDVVSSMVRRGGGVNSLTLRFLPRPDGQMMSVIHVYMNAVDAMGANSINQVCEYLKPYIEQATKETVTMCILSNLVDSKLTKAKLVLEKVDPSLAFKIEEASFFAESDPYRAATHNKGVMNGIDPLVVATGNDWRAVEAGVHAYASRSGVYSSVTRWRRQGDHQLVGELEAPLVVGVVGGVTQLHPMARLSLKLLQNPSAKELSQIMGAVGLVQNLGALQALTTEGISQGHMKLHSKNLALSAGAGPEELNQVIHELEVLLKTQKRIFLKDAQNILTHLRFKAEE
jgi:hydroxymethylglutaryl-CoA reductase